MKILVISDIHLGDGSKSDDFGNRANEIKLKKWIEKQKADRIYLNGDIYELWQFKPQAVKNAHYMFWKYLHGRKFVHIRGNHDYQLMGPLTKTLKTKSGKRVLISHGFQNDKLMTNPFSRLFVWIIGQTLEKLFPDIDNEDGYKHKRNKSRTIRNTLKYAEKMWKRYDIVILGHSHKQMTERSYVYGIYANCGTCANGKLQGVLLDTLTDKVTLV